jgi:hypothetical protein
MESRMEGRHDQRRSPHASRIRVQWPFCLFPHSLPSARVLVSCQHDLRTGWDCLSIDRPSGLGASSRAVRTRTNHRLRVCIPHRSCFHWILQRRRRPSRQFFHFLSALVPFDPRCLHSCVDMVMAVPYFKQADPRCDDETTSIELSPTRQLSFHQYSRHTSTKQCAHRESPPEKYIVTNWQKCFSNSPCLPGMRVEIRLRRIGQRLQIERDRIPRNLKIDLEVVVDVAIAKACYFFPGNID